MSLVSVGRARRLRLNLTDGRLELGLQRPWRGMRGSRGTLPGNGGHFHLPGLASRIDKASKKPALMCWLDYGLVCFAWLYYRNGLLVSSARAFLHLFFGNKLTSFCALVYCLGLISHVGFPPSLRFTYKIGPVGTIPLKIRWRFA